MITEAQKIYIKNGVPEDGLVERMNKGPHIEKDLVETRVKRLFEEVNSLRRKLQEYRNEEIEGLRIKDKETGKERNMIGAEVHNKITALTAILEGRQEHDEDKSKKTEELRIILRDVKEWLEKKNKEI